MVAKYEYDAWGNVLTVTNSNNSEITDPNHIANLNPFRYRSYYYDSESGLYYLMSRYYDPVTHRFVNADGYFQSGDNILDTNMNAYCGNNPVGRIDSNGEFWGVIIAAVVVVAVLVTTLVVAVSDPDNSVCGASANVVSEINNYEKRVLPEISPINFTTGSKSEYTYENYGDSSKFSSVYATEQINNPVLSYVGYKLNISDYTLDLSLGLDNTGIKFLYNKDNSSYAFNLNADITKASINIGVENTIWVEPSSNTTQYSYFSVNALLIAAILYGYDSSYSTQTVPAT